MTSSHFGSGLPVAQQNFGSGTFLAGPNFGTIETMDAQTKAVLVKIAADVPTVRALLTKALDQGLISPETVDALTSVAQNITPEIAAQIWEGGRHINEDVASWIRQGGQHINEDVAGWLLQASQSINEDVAGSFRQTASDLDQAAGRFEDVAGRLGRAAHTLRSTQANTTQWERTAAAMSQAAAELAMAAQMQSEGPSTRWSFKNGVITGFGLAFALAVAVLAITLKVTAG